MGGFWEKQSTTEGYTSFREHKVEDNLEDEYLPVTASTAIYTIYTSYWKSGMHNNCLVNTV